MRHRPLHGGRRPSARRPPPSRRAGAAPGGHGRSGTSSCAGASRRRPTSAARAQSRSRSRRGDVRGARAWGCATTSTRTASSACCSGSPGGIDSALTACVAVDALGSDRVACAVMPSPHSSPETQSDARTLADNLEIDRVEMRLEPLMEAYDRVLSEPFKGTEKGIAEENIQARIRGNLLMALSNKFGWLVLTTGNKSEYSVGYTTLYGDMAGGFGVLKDVPKTLVYRLAHYRNEPREAPGHPGADHRAPPLGRAAPRPARHGQPASLRPARRDPRGLRRGGPGPRPADPSRYAGGRRGPRDPHGRRGRVQAPPGAAWHQDHAEGVRPRPAAADHEPVSGRPG